MPNQTDGFEVYKDKRGAFRWRRTGSDGAIIGCASEGYSKRADAEANMNRGTNPKDKWEFYTDKRSAHRWRRRAQNGALVGASPTGYKSLNEAQTNATLNGWTG